MGKRSHRLHFAPLQRIVAEPISDPTEPTVIDGREEGPRRNGGARAARASRVLDLARRLPASERLPLLLQLAARLSSAGQLQLLERLAVLLPSNLLRQAEKELRTRLGEKAS